MNKTDILDIARANNGYLYGDIIKINKIKSIYINRLYKSGILKKIDRGIYVLDDTIEDSLYIKSLKYKKIIYSGVTALYLNGLSNKGYSYCEATFPYGYNVKIDGVLMKHTRKDTFNLGASNIETMFGNKVKAYDKERCICDLFIRPNNYDYEDRVFAINEYKSYYLDYDKLYNYAKKLGVYDEVKNVFEVIGWN